MSDLVSDLVSCDMHPFTPPHSPIPQPQPHPQRASMCNSYTPRYFLDGVVFVYKKRLLFHQENYFISRIFCVQLPVLYFKWLPLY